jgi:prepilin-type N-terminal cleavage/methylation domain-containing protein
MITVVPSRVRRTAGFTMIELALCIAIVAIAMVAIMGVMPAGMGVQKQNREDTIIAQDATHWMEAIRGGALLFDDVTNYVDFIAVRRQMTGSPQVLTNYYPGIFFNSPGANALDPSRRLTRSETVFGLLSLPKYDTLPNDFANNPVSLTNTVTAVVRAFSGSLNDKILPQNLSDRPADSQLGFAFRYLMRVEIVPVATLPKDRSPLGLRQWAAMQRGLYDVRLTFDWPVSGTDFAVRTGSSQRTFRTQVAAQDRYQRDTNGNIIKAPSSTIHLRQLAPASSRLPVL